MSRATTTSPLRQGRFLYKLGMLAIVPMLLFAACSSGGDGGGGSTTTTNNPSTGGSTANQFGYVIDAGVSEIRAFTVDGTNGNLTQIGSAISTGSFPHHVDVDPAGRFVYVSNHDSTFLSGWQINQDGSLAPINPAAGSPVTGGDPTENEPHSSIIDRTGQFLYVVAGTGASTLRAYRINTTAGPTLGTLTFIAGQSFPVGTHAHNITVSPNNQFLYVAVEGPPGGDGQVFAFSRDTTTGSLTAVGVMAGMPTCDAVAVDPQNKFVFAAYSNAVDVFSIGANGALTRIVPTSTFSTNNRGTGSGPHSMTIHPNGQSLYTANINANTVSVFRVDPATGALTEIQIPNPTTGPDPNFVYIHPNGSVLYTADTRNPGQISMFTINADGTLTAGTPIASAVAGIGPNGIGTTKK